MNCYWKEEKAKYKKMFKQPKHILDNAIRMAIEQDKRNSRKPDYVKRNWLIVKLRREGNTFKKIGDMLGITKNRVREIHIGCLKKIYKNVSKLNQRSQNA